MNPVDEPLLRSMASLRYDNRFMVVLEWLRASLAEQDFKNRRLSGDALMRGQGLSLCLERVLDVAGSADALIKR